MKRLVSAHRIAGIALIGIGVVLGAQISQAQATADPETNPVLSRSVTELKEISCLAIFFLTGAKNMPEGAEQALVIGMIFTLIADRYELEKPTDVQRILAYGAGEGWDRATCLQEVLEHGLLNDLLAKWEKLE